MKRGNVSIANDILGENLEAEVAPFCFSHLSCDDEIRAAAYAYTPSLIQKVTNLVDENERQSIFSNLISAVSLNSVGTLMWHNGVIPETEIWSNSEVIKAVVHLK